MSVHYSPTSDNECDKLVESMMFMPVDTLAMAEVQMVMTPLIAKLATLGLGDHQHP